MIKQHVDSIERSQGTTEEGQQRGRVGFGMLTLFRVEHQVGDSVGHNYLTVHVFAPYELRSEVKKDPPRLNDVHSRVRMGLKCMGLVKDGVIEVD